MPVPLPISEEARLTALQRYDILDTPPERVFDRITLLAQQLLDVPIALVSFVDRDRQWFKSRQGLEATQTAREMAFCAHAICGDGPLVVPNALEDARFCDNPLVTGEPQIRFYAGAPLRTRDGHKLGTLCVIDRQPRTLSVPQSEALETLATMVMEELELRWAGHKAMAELREQESQMAELHRLATTDPLTGALNRRAFFDLAAKEWARAARYRHSLSLLAIDADNFKQVNDRLGHGAGDDILKALVTIIGRSLRACDVLGRLGGEEFAVLAPQTDTEGAAAIAERVRRQVAEMGNAGALDLSPCTVSIGVTDCRPARETLEDAMRRADALLYSAKKAGRNRVASDSATTAGR